MFNDQTRSRLLNIAAEMVRGKGMPPEFVSDWDLPKTTPVAARREIGYQVTTARQQCRDWSKRIMEILKEGSE